ncbi:MAG: type II toxin-antitoxin system VapC family toxin [Deltaproteobacteria bacterium]|nr:type II toxin-antitoxin system VapC family toxin [Deltaproteobacteria bacterium]MBI2341165.1 type II toxin-antitoxin system VapC family toxin [Deltaproteobacteria bacterium]MBI2974684.1 type II toxin-antitoxin system VapC family toxin [Deltaproteobacteria bacterium]
MNILIDSSVWLEYFSGGSKAKGLEKFFKPPNKIILPSIVAYEVYKKIKAEKGEAFAVLLLAQMERLSSTIASIDQALAVQAADISLQHKIPMADSMIYSVALYSESTVITMDSHFKDLPACQLV